MTGLLLAAALACLAAGAAVDLVLGPRTAAGRATPYALAVAASGCLVAVGIRAVTGQEVRIGIASVFGVGRGALLVDPLAGLFLTLLFGTGAAVSACCIAWSSPPTARAQGRGMASAYLLLLASVAVIVCAADAFLFLFAWESLTVAFFVLTSQPRRDDDGARAPWATVATGKVGGAALLLGFLLLAGRSGSFTIASWHSVGQGALHDVVWVLLVAGFGAKVGLVPFHVWIPEGYPAASGPARAAMAGIAANVGFYGLWRFLGVLGRPPVWLVISVLLIGGVTAFLGILFAGVQPSLGRVISYSSVENAGIIVTAYGVALTGAAVGSSPLEAVGLLAATLQMIAHAVAKSSLFSALAFVERATGSDDLDALRGVGRRSRWSGAALGAGALTLSGLPPTIGFVSEWFVLEALMQQFRLSGLALRLALAGAGALVALTSGLAALTFLRVLGLAVLGRPPGVAEGRMDDGPVGKAGLAVLGAGCLGLATAGPWVVRFCASGLASLVPPATTRHALSSPWVLQPVFGGFSILSPSWLWVAFPVAWAAVVAMAVVLSRGRVLRVRRVPAWRSATPGVAGPASYTAFGFSNPLRHVLANVLGTSRAREVVSAEGPEQADGVHVESRTTVVEPIEAYLYRPVWAGLQWAGRVARRLQSGDLGAYVAYMLLALLAALAVTAALR